MEEREATGGVEGWTWIGREGMEVDSIDCAGYDGDDELWRLLVCNVSLILRNTVEKETQRDNHTEYCDGTTYHKQ